MTEYEGDVEVDIIGFRGISERVARAHDVKTKFVNGNPVERKFPYGNSAAKIKYLNPDGSSDKKRMKCVGEFKDAGFFGMDRYDPGSRPAITIYEGEEDALAGEEILGDKRSAHVSLKSGAGSAHSDCLKFWDYLNSFDKIYFCFDADEPGEKALSTLLGMFDFRKVYHVKLGKYKDANGYLLAGAADDFESAWNAAKRFAPDTLISSFSDIRKALLESREDILGTYPFAGLNDKLYGLHGGEIVVVKAPEGVGKTEFFRAIEYHLLQTTDHPMCVIHLEEDNGTTVKALAGYALEVPATLPDCGLSEEDILDGYKKAVKNIEGRLHIHSAFNVEEEDKFFGTIRFVAALGVKFVTLDHISWMGTGLGNNIEDDERKKLDRISQKLKLLAKELRICIIIISHVNDDGKTRGSRNITKVANTVISLSRDILSDSNVMEFMVEKARLGGRTGPAGCAYFDRDKGKLVEEKPVSGHVWPINSISEPEDRF